MDDATQPRIEILGPPRLVNAAGRPGRDPRRCLEYAAYLKERPGATTTQLAAVFDVSTATVRSVVTYLRAWLGADPNGVPYLPVAYTGGYRIKVEVSTDWEEFSHLAQEPNGQDIEKKTRAMMLVRGAPLEGDPPAAWHWAEYLRTDIESSVRDTAHALVELALDRNDTDLARWAAGRGLVANPEDETLLLDRLKTENRAGNRSEFNRIAARITGQCRRVGIPPNPATARALKTGLT